VKLIQLYFIIEIVGKQAELLLVDLRRKEIWSNIFSSTRMII